MLRNTQSDKRWAFESMCLTKDFLKDYGCLVTSIANIVETTPKEANLLLVKNKGYNYLQNPNCKKNTESFIVWSVAEKIFNIKHINDYKGDMLFSENTYYIARILHKKYHTGHYVNLLVAFINDFTVFDTDFGTIDNLTQKDITKIIRITRI